MVVAVIVKIDVAMAFNRRFFVFLLRPRVASWSLSFTAVACSSRMNVNMMQCCGNRSYDPETRIAPVSGTKKRAHR